MVLNTNKKPAKPIIFVSGDKGGVGKSFAARTIAAWLRAKSLPVVGFDGDGRNAHLERYYAKSMPIQRASLRSHDGWSAMYQKFETCPADAMIVVDLPGNIGGAMDDETERLGRVAQALNRRLIIAWVGSEEEDSIWLLPYALRLVGAPQTVFLMNGRFGSDPSKFELWMQSNTREQFMIDGGCEAYLPLLPIYPRTKIATARSPFDDLSQANLTVTEQVDFDMWWSQVDHSLVPLSRMLGVK